MWKKPAMAFGGAVIAVALVIGVAALVRQPPAETPIAAVTTTSPETTTTAQVTTSTVAVTDTPAGPIPPGCPDEGFQAPGPQEGLPEPVAAIREQIIAAALACDVDALAALGGSDLILSFESVEPERFLTDAVERGRPLLESGESLLEVLVKTLGLPHRHYILEDGDGPTGESFYVWPSVFGLDAGEDVPEAERDALLQLYTQEELDQMAEFGGFIGWRVGIIPEGDWRFFIAGD